MNKRKRFVFLSIQVTSTSSSVFVSETQYFSKNSPWIQDLEENSNIPVKCDIKNSLEYNIHCGAITWKENIIPHKRSCNTSLQKQNLNAEVHIPLFNSSTQSIRFITSLLQTSHCGLRLIVTILTRLLRRLNSEYSIYMYLANRKIFSNS